MKIILLSFFLSLFCNTLFASFLNKQELDYIQKNPTINIGVEKDYPPYDFIQKGYHQGIVSDYLQLISKKTGLKFKLKSGYSWNELLILAKDSKIDLLPILVNTKHRQEFLNFTQPYLKVKQYIYTLKNNTSIMTMQDLDFKTIAVPKGYALIDILKNDYPNIKIIKTQNTAQSIDYLVTKKVDALIENNLIINYLKKELNIQNIEAKVAVKLLNENLSMGINKNKPILQSIISKALSNISLSERNTILNKWTLQSEYQNYNLNLTKEEREFLSTLKEIKVANFKSWAPYNYNANHTPKGYLVDYMNLISEKINIPISYKTGNMSSILKELKEGEIDVASSLMKNTQRLKYLNFTNAYITQHNVITTLDDRNDIVSIQNLNHKKVGLVKNWYFTEIIRSTYPEIKVKLFETSSQALESLSKGEIDACVNDYATINYYINKKLLNNLKISGNVNIKGIQNDLYIGVKKECPLLTSIIDKAIDQITPLELTTLNKKWLTTKQYNLQEILTPEEKKYLSNKLFKVTASKSWAPFNFKEMPDGYIQGFCVDFWKLLAKKANIHYELSLQDSFTQALNSLKLKENDLIFGTGYTKEKSLMGAFTKTYQSFPIAIATKKQDYMVLNKDSLVGKRVAVGKNFTAHKILKRNEKDLNLIPVQDIPHALQLLTENKVDAVVGIMPALTYYINTKGYSNVHISGVTGYDFNLKFLVRNEYRSLIPILNKLINSLNAEEKQKIYDRWINVPYTNPIDYSLILEVCLFISLIIGIIVYRQYQQKKYLNIIQQKRSNIIEQTNELERTNFKLEETKKTLEDSLFNFKLLVNSALETLLIVHNWKIIYLNDAAKELLKVESKDDIIGKQLLEFFDNNTKKPYMDIFSKITNETHELIAKNNQEETFPALVKIKEIIYENKSCKIISMIDLSELKQKEKLIQEQAKLASMGAMIGNIAHQWRQPLSIISTSASGLQMAKSFNNLEENLLDESLETILDNTKYLSKTIDDFSHFIQNSDEIVEFSLNDILDKALLLLESSFEKNHIEIFSEIQEDVYLFNYKNELNQAFLNILNNSIDALTNNNAQDQRYIFIKAYQDNKNAIIKIRDNAGGINKELLNKIFEPYVSSKHKSQGIGLGLYVTHKLITKNIKGTILIENISYIYKENREQGTEIYISIPLLKRDLDIVKSNNE